jgi:hypothetical protein
MADNIVLVQESPRGPSMLIEVPVIANGKQRINFPDVQQLRSTEDLIIIIKSLRVIPLAVLAAGPTSGVNAPNAELVKMTLVIYCEGWEKAQYIPVLVLNDLENATVPFRFNATKFDNWKKVDWTKSYLQLGNGLTTANTPYNVLFEVEYERITANGQIILGAQ